jgi:hypothetical protein
VPTDDSEMRDALADYNARVAGTADRTRRLVGLGLCAGAVASWAISIFAALTVLTDPAVTSDLEAGTHISHVAGIGWTSAVCGVLGLLVLVAALWRGPSLIRWIGGLILLLGGVPVLWLATFTFLLSR